MKRTSLAKRNALFSLKGVSGGLGVLGIVVILGIIHMGSPAMFWRITSPLFSVGNGAAQYVGTLLYGFSNAQTLSVRVTELEAENAALASENAALRMQNADIAGLSVPGTPAGIAAGVLARMPVSPYDSLVVSAGTAEGVALGMEAFAPGNVPIGVVAMAAAHFSRVTLFSAPRIHTNGWVGAAHAPLTLIGSGGGTFLATVPSATVVSVGDIVSLPGPGALPIGVVARIDGNAADPTEILRISPAVNPFSLTWITLRTGVPPALLVGTTTSVMAP